jgi:hypothetical protein
MNAGIPLRLLLATGAACAASLPARDRADDASVRLRRTDDSRQRVIAVPIPRRQLEGTVHGALRAYDLPDLVALAGHVQHHDPLDGAGKLLPAR